MIATIDLQMDFGRGREGERERERERETFHFSNALLDKRSPSKSVEHILKPVPKLLVNREGYSVLKA